MKLADKHQSKCSARYAVLRDDGKLEVHDGDSVSVPVAKWIARVDEWKSIMAQASQKHGVPIAIIAANVAIESGGNPNAVSASKAVGLMQLMPTTYSALSGKAFVQSEALDPATNVDLGTKLLAKLLKTFAWDLVKVEAAYNSGGVYCATLKGCKPNPWGLRVNCPGGDNHIDKAIAAYNAAVEHGYDWTGSGGAAGAGSSSGLGVPAFIATTSAIAVALFLL